jgi:hypothetical protein
VQSVADLRPGEAVPDPVTHRDHDGCVVDVGVGGRGEPDGGGEGEGGKSELLHDHSPRVGPDVDSVLGLARNVRAKGFFSDIR